MNRTHSLALGGAIIPWIAACVVGVWIFFDHYPLSGVRVMRGPLDGSRPWLTSFLPAERVSVPGPQQDGWHGQRVFDDPVYASVRVPGPYDQMEIALDARPLRQPLVDIGIMRDPATQAFEMHPLWSAELERGWRSVRTETREGFVRDGLPDRTLDQADFTKIVFWHASATPPLLMDRALVSPRSYDVSLRGAHDFYLVPVDGTISFDVVLQDMNRSRGGNVAALRLMHHETIVWTDAVSVGGARDEKPQEPFERRLRADHLAPGVYRLSFIMDDNVFIRRLTTTAKRWVIGPRLYFGDDVGYAATGTRITSAWTNSQHATVATLHREGLQPVRFGSATVTLARTHQAYALDRKAEERVYAIRLSAERGDVRMIGDGFFSFDADALFLPQPRRLTDATDLDGEGIVAVVTPYKKPEVLENGWMRWRAIFDVSQTSGYAKMVLSAPHVFARQGAIDVRAFVLRFERPPLGLRAWWQAVRKEMASAVRAL